MIVTNLEKMEKIVARNKELSWVGWDVRDLKRSGAGRTAINGVRVDGVWYLQRIYSVIVTGKQIGRAHV